MNQLLTPSMLVLTREAKGWSQRDLAAQSGLSQSVISKIESGAIDVTGERLAHLARKLDCPPALLSHPAIRVDNANTCLHHRRRHSKLSAAATRRIEGVAHLTRVSVEGIFDGVNVQLKTDIDPSEVAARVRVRQLVLEDGTADPSPADADGRTDDFSKLELPGLFPTTALPSSEDAPGYSPVRADAAAQFVRERWSLTGPIANLIDTLERHGILIVYRSLGSRAQDGVSSWPADLTHPPIIVINEGLPADRIRFTVAHEFAHLLLHRIPTDHAEREANRFAAELLVPAAQIAIELEGLTTGDLARLARLKEQWGVSIGMLVQRARDIDAISERQFREFRVRLTRLGWDINEPGNLPVEKPALLDKAIAIGRESLGLNTEELAEMAYMTPSSFQRHYLRPEPDGRAPRQVLNLDAPTPTGSTDDGATSGGNES